MAEIRSVITIGREFGSGGHETGRLLAEKLGIPFYDKEILSRAAQASGICEEMFEHHDEKATPSYLFSLVTGMGMAEAPSYPAEMPLNHRIFMAQFEAISKLALEGPCVIVGRCADYVLKGQPNVVNVFVYSDVESRVARIMQVENLPQDKAKERIRKMDKQRQSYYNFFADGNWGHRSNYDLMLNTHGISLEHAADAIIAFVKAREAE